MIKITLTLFIALISLNSNALEAKWLGVAGISLSDGKTTLLFDPIATKPGLGNWLFNMEFKSDPEKLESFMKLHQIKNVKGLFVSHTHFDHAVDAPAISALTGAPTYGGASLKILSEKTPKAKHVLSKPGERFEIGDFRVTMIERSHPPIFPAIGFHFMPGKVQPDFDFSFYDYRHGEVWGFYVEHPEGNILIDQGSHFQAENSKYAQKVKAYFLGIANKESVKDLVDSNIGIIKPQIVLPLHTDFFLLQSTFLESLQLPGIELEEIKRSVEDKFRGMRFLRPKLGESISI